MRFITFSTTLLALARYAAAFGVTVKFEESTVTAGAAMTLDFADAGGSPGLANLNTGTIQLMVGGNLASNMMPLDVLGTITYASATTISVVIKPGLAGNVANGFFLAVTSNVIDGGSVINYSDRFSIVGMVGTTPAAYVTAAGAASGSPAAVNNVAAAAPAAGAGGAPAAGQFTVPYYLQTGLTKYAPMQSVPPTKITKKNPTPLYSTSAYTKATTWLPRPTVLSTITAPQTFSVVSIENTAAPQSMPTGDMAKFLARWRD